MCGRYYVDDDTARAIERLVRETEGKRMETGEILPSRTASVIRGNESCLRLQEMRWGFPRFDGKGLLINARAESVLSKSSFQESVRNRRCVIPAKGFYEWNRHKEKFHYERTDAPFLFMAGCYREFYGTDCFVILTTEANASVAPVHSRMPLLLEPEELENWVFDSRAAEGLLHKIPALLKSGTEYEQMRFID